MKTKLKKVTAATKAKRAAAQKKMDELLATVKEMIPSHWVAHEGFYMGFGSGGGVSTTPSLIMVRPDFKNIKKEKVVKLKYPTRSRTTRRAYSTEQYGTFAAEGQQIKKRAEEAGFKVRITGLSSLDIIIPA